MQHLNLDSASIMRNKLAEDMIDAKMLFLMQVFIFIALHAYNFTNDRDFVLVNCLSSD